MFKSFVTSSVAAALAVLISLPARAEDPKKGVEVDVNTNKAKVKVDVNRDPSRDRLGEADDVTGRRTIRASQFVGMNVYSAQDKETSLGEVNDLVVDSSTGRIRYVALSYGGLLGIGDKLFAIPWQSFKTATNDDNETMLLLNMNQKQFEDAPGFNQDAWPDFSDSKFTDTVDKYYGTQKRDRTNRPSNTTPRKPGTTIPKTTP